MIPTFKKSLRWFNLVWSDAPDESSRAWRLHVRGLMIGWTLTALAMALVETFPNEAKLSMYGMLLDADLPLPQRFLSAIEIAAPLVMAWHLVGLQRWGKRLKA
jgi:hypothetical protein